MKIMVSACLLGRKCKYSGGSNLNENVVDFADRNGAELIEICPEVMGGLPVPRTPSEIKDGRVISADGRDVDREFRKGAEKSLEIARREKPDLVILKSGSPSCGLHEIYDGTFSGVRIPGSGVTADLLVRNGFRVVDERQIADYTESERRK